MFLNEKNKTYIISQISLQLLSKHRKLLSDTAVYDPHTHESLYRIQRLKFDHVQKVFTNSFKSLKFKFKNIARRVSVRLLQKPFRGSSSTPVQTGFSMFTFKTRD